MTELRERFRSLDRFHRPNLWPDVLTREPRSAVPPPPRSRLTAVAVALIVAAIGLGMAGFVFLGRGPSPSGATSAVAQLEGRIAFVRNDAGRSTILIASREGVHEVTALRPLGAQVVRSPSVSPDGSHLAFAKGTSEQLDIYVSDLDGGGVRRLAQGGVNDYPSWSPSGNELAFVSDRQGTFALYVISLDNNLIRRVTPRWMALPHGTLHDLGPSWSPDGRDIAFTASEMETVGPCSPPACVALPHLSVWRIGADGSGLTRLTSGAASTYSPAWSPTGTSIAFVGGGAKPGIWVMNSDGSRERPFPNGVGGNDPAWSPSGSMIAFVKSGTSGEFVYPAALRVERSDGTYPATISDVPMDCCPSWGP